MQAYPILLDGCPARSSSAIFGMDGEVFRSDLSRDAPSWVPPEDEMSSAAFVSRMFRDSPSWAPPQNELPNQISLEEETPSWMLPQNESGQDELPSWMFPRDNSCQFSQQSSWPEYSASCWDLLGGEGSSRHDNLDPPYQPSSWQKSMPEFINMSQAEYEFSSVNDNLDAPRHPTRWQEHPALARFQDTSMSQVEYEGSSQSDALDPLRQPSSWQDCTGFARSQCNNISKVEYEGSSPDDILEPNHHSSSWPEYAALGPSPGLDAVLALLRDVDKERSEAGSDQPDREEEEDGLGDGALSDCSTVDSSTTRGTMHAQVGAFGLQNPASASSFSGDECRTRPSARWLALWCDEGAFKNTAVSFRRSLEQMGARVRAYKAVHTFVRSLEGGGPGIVPGRPCILFCTWRTRHAVELLAYVQNNGPTEGAPFSRRERGSVSICILVSRSPRQGSRAEKWITAMQPNLNCKLMTYAGLNATLIGVSQLLGVPVVPLPPDIDQSNEATSLSAVELQGTGLGCDYRRSEPRSHMSVQSARAPPLLRADYQDQPSLNAAHSQYRMCTACYRPASHHAKFCQWCGTCISQREAAQPPPPPMPSCQQCGYQLESPSAKFCVVCGAARSTSRN